MAIVMIIACTLHRMIQGFSGLINKGLKAIVVTIACTLHRMIRGLFGLINEGLKTIVVTTALTPCRMIQELPPRQMYLLCRWFEFMASLQI